MSRRLLFLLVFLVLDLVSAGRWRRVWAEDDTAAGIVRQGVELRKSGRDVEALAEFKRAMAIKKSPRTQAQIALAEQALGLWVAAEEDLQEAVSQADDPWIRKNISVLRKAMSVIQTHLSTLEVWGTPAGATIFIDTKPVGKLPLKRSVRVAEGSVLVAARAEGYLAATRTVNVRPGQTIREHVELLPSAAEGVHAKTDEAAGVAVPPPLSSNRGQAEAQPTVGGVAASDDAQERHLAPADGSSSRLRPFAWAAGVGGLAGLAFGVVEMLARKRDKDAFDGYVFHDPNSGQLIRNYCNTESLMPECKPLEAAFNRSTTLMVVGYAVGGVLTAGSTILFLLSSSSGVSGADSPRRSAIACAPELINGRGMSCRLAF